MLEPVDGELTLVAVHPGADAEAARAATGWDLRVAGGLRETEPPSEAELAALRGLRTKGEAGMSVATDPTRARSSSRTTRAWAGTSRSTTPATARPAGALRRGRS